MTRISIFLVFIFGGLACMATPSSVPTSSQNYIRTRTYTSADALQFIDQIVYYDGLGRPVETVQHQITPNKKDLVSRLEYDSLGRQYKTWLPSPSANNTGAYNGSSTAATFYNDSKAFSETVYEASPLNRVEKQYGPGQAWRSGDHSVKSGYLTNNTTANSELACMLYELSPSNHQTFLCKGYYPAGQLYVSKTTDEDGHIAYEFTDKLSRLILQRRVIAANNYADVNYVYDDFGRLKFVLPPLASDQLNQTGQSYNLWQTVSGTPVSSLVYFYAYDNRGRKTSQTLMVTSVENLVYDKSDRLVFHSTIDAQTIADGERGWIFYKYDVFGRQILTGRYHGDDFSGKDSNTRAAQMEQRCQNALIVEAPDLSDPSGYGYTWNNFPTFVDDPDLEITQVSYYDNYNYIQANYPELNYQTKAGFGTQHTSAKGLLTATRTVLLDDSGNETISAFYYDTKGNLVQKHSISHIDYHDFEYYAYDFNNRMTKKRVEFQNGPAKISLGGAISFSTLPEEYNYHYDPAGRLDTVWYSFNNATPIPLSSYAYDEVGRVASKKIGNVETQTYAYNLRGWTTTIGGSKFTESLYYNTNPFSSADSYFNGNISLIEWSDPTKSGRGYSFTYDALDRLKNATYTGLFPSGNYGESFTYDKMGNILTLKRYGLKDNNTFGLIDDLTMPEYSGCYLKRVDDAAGDQSASDVMEFKNGYNGSGEYVYHNGKIYSDFNKKICSTRYNYLALPSRVQFQYGHQINYAYDAAGVKRRVIHRESGQNQNLPTYAWYPEVPNNVFILETKTDYVGNRIYEQIWDANYPYQAQLNTLKRILTEEGYIEKNGSNYTFHYYLKDHLGNVRVVLDNNGNTEQVTNYYPSGTVIAEYPRRTDQGVQPYKFGTKELDRSNGLDFYDFMARQLQSDLMRFRTPDPLREKYYGISPYAYCANNPLKYTDKTGMWIESAWDAFSLVTGAKSFVDNLIAGNVGAAIVDGIGVIADGVALAVPLLPGGVGAAIKGVRVADKAVDAVKAGNKVENAVSAGKTVDNVEKTGKIYKVGGDKTRSGDPYIGRTTQSTPEKRGAGAKDGRDRKGAEVIDTYNPKNAGEGSYKEQKAILDNGGVEKLDNRRNEATTERMKELEKKYGNN